MAVTAVARYRSRLRMPMRYAGASFAEREGLYVLAEGPAGEGIGEVAPLPGVHRETVDGCLAWLASPVGSPPPSLAFGLDVARALADGDPVLARPLRDRVGVNQLLGDGQAPAADARTVKVKVGRGDLAAEARRLGELSASRPDLRLRIDANRSLSLDDARRLVEGLDPARVEYVEEPLREPLELPAFHFATGLAVALDESLHEPALRSALETAPGVVAHVMKPSLVGGLLAVRERAERTARQGLRTVVTSSFESSYSLGVLARLVTWLPAAQGDHGLGTAGILVDDPCPAPPCEGWWLSTADDLPRPAVRFERREAARG